MTRQKSFFLLRVICFLLLAALLLRAATYVLTPKADYGICSMDNLYRQEKDSVDVLCVGTSLCYAGVNTNILWDEYGIASYDLCSAEQPFYISYYLIREVLKTQHPKVIVLDAKPATYTRDYTRHGRTILSTYGIRGIDNRAGAILACTEDRKTALSYLLALPEVHSNYQRVTREDFVWPLTNGGRGSTWKGFIEEDHQESHRRPSLTWTDIRVPINQREEEYVRKIMQLCREKGIALLLTAFPNPDYASDHMNYNMLWSIASEYAVPHINYNDPTMRYGLRYSTDFADWQHLNVKGSITLSRKLGADLKDRYDLPDRRDDPRYASYGECAAQWFLKYPKEAF